MATTYLTRTQTAGNQKTWTLSVWFKRSNLGVSHIMPWCAGTYSSTNTMQIFFSANDCLDIHGYASDSSLTYQLTTNRTFRDTSGWYHLVVACDTTQGAAADRLKFYINGVHETSLSTASYPALNHDTAVNQNTIPMVIGNRNGASYYFGGLMSHLHIIDGTAYPASTFGSTDATTGEWKIITGPSVTYGTNGAFILKDGNSVTDQSGEGNNFTVGGGTLTNTEDNPSDVFCTFNPLIVRIGRTQPTWANGNTKVTHNDSGGLTPSWGTLGASKGKYYWENKVVTVGYCYIGIWQPEYNNGVMSDALDGINVYRQDGKKQAETAATAALYGDSFTDGDIIGVAVNCDTGTIWFSKNGTWQNSATIAEIGAGTTTNAAYTGKSYSDGIIPSISAYNTSVHEINFGNGYFGTTAITSEGTNASNIGKFEYDVPTGFTALSTKGLNE